MIVPVRSPSSVALLDHLSIPFQEQSVRLDQFPGSPHQSHRPTVSPGDLAPPKEVGNRCHCQSGISSKEQELESASIVDKLLPGYREKRKEAAKLAARFIGASEEMERTQSELNQLEQQRRTFEQWQASPKTREMERRRDYLSTQDAQTRLREIKQQQLERSRQQKPSREQGWGLHL